MHEASLTISENISKRAMLDSLMQQINVRYPGGVTTGSRVPARGSMPGNEKPSSASNAPM